MRTGAPVSIPTPRFHIQIRLDRSLIALSEFYRSQAAVNEESFERQAHSFKYFSWLMAEPFVGPPRPAPWFPCGLASSFVDITQANAGPLSQIAPCSTEDPQPTGCRVFLAPSKNGGDNGLDTVIELSRDPKDQVNKTLRAGDQVLVFKYNGKIHAIDNVCSRDHKDRHKC